MRQRARIAEAFPQKPQTEHYDRKQNIEHTRGQSRPGLAGIALFLVDVVWRSTSCSDTRHSSTRALTNTYPHSSATPRALLLGPTNQTFSPIPHSRTHQKPRVHPTQTRAPAPN